LDRLIHPTIRFSLKTIRREKAPKPTDSFGRIRSGPAAERYRRLLSSASYSSGTSAMTLWTLNFQPAAVFTKTSSTVPVDMIEGCFLLTSTTDQ
jgi:hypothetical protein